MKYRIQFSKTGRLKFIGHLDLLRTFQRVLKRAQIPLAYSQGFNPHPLLSFAHPLALGSTGLREYMEMQLEKEMEEKEILARLNANFPEHLHASLCERIPEGTPAAMAQVCAARYTTVSYTHLDVYKRQSYRNWSILRFLRCPAIGFYFGSMAESGC